MQCSTVRRRYTPAADRRLYEMKISCRLLGWGGACKETSAEHLGGQETTVGQHYITIARLTIVIILDFDSLNV